MRIRNGKRRPRAPSRWLRRHPLLRLLFWNARFRAAFISLTALLVSLALAAPPLWTVSPPGFLPVVKISALDWLEAQSLARTARRQTAARQWRLADFAWQAAVANDPADAELLRGLLENLMLAESLSRAERNHGLAAGLWLLRLAQTNRADLELTAQFCNQTRQFEWTQALLARNDPPRTPAQQRAYLKSAFQLGDFNRCSRAWLPPANDADPEWPLYAAAFASAWGANDEQNRGRAALESGAHRGPHSTLALELALAAAAARRDLADAQRAWNQLERRPEIRLADRTRFCNLLADFGELSQAQRLAQGPSAAPESAAELIEAAQTLRSLRLPACALRLLQREAPRFEESSPVWILQGDLLEQTRRWDDLRRLGIELRCRNAGGGALRAFSYYFEGRADAAQSRARSARANFSRAGQARIEFGKWVPELALRMVKLGFGQCAKRLLRHHERWQSGDREFWSVAFQLAEAQRDGSWLRHCAEAQVRLAPRDPSARNHLAFALLVNRSDPARAVRLTWELTLEPSADRAEAINHALALAANQRGEEAYERLCSMISVPPKEPLAHNSFCLAEFESCFQTGRWRQAQRWANQIEPELLWPEQRAWFDAARRRLASMPYAEIHSRAALPRRPRKRPAPKSQQNEICRAR